MTADTAIVWQYIMWSSADIHQQDFKPCSMAICEISLLAESNPLKQVAFIELKQAMYNKFVHVRWFAESHLEHYSKLKFRLKLCRSSFMKPIVSTLIM